MRLAEIAQSEFVDQLKTPAYAAIVDRFEHLKEVFADIGWAMAYKYDSSAKSFDIRLVVLPDQEYTESTMSMIAKFRRSTAVLPIHANLQSADDELIHFTTTMDH